jgi:exosortase
MTTLIGCLATARKSVLAWPRSYAVWLQTTAVLALIAILFTDVLADMAYDWWTEPAWSHGMLLPPLAAYIAWLHRARTLEQPVTTDLRGLVLIGFACLIFVLGKLASEFFLPRISFVFLLAGLIWTFWGAARARTLIFPLLLLFTMVPLPALVYNSLAAPLQRLASDWATAIATGLGVSVFREGNIIQLAGISLGVAEACSGLNSLSALLVGSMLVGYLFCRRPLPRVTLVVLGIPLAIGINILRVAGTALLADYNERYALGFYHSFSGWLVFVAGFGVLYVIAAALHRWMDGHEPA